MSPSKKIYHKLDAKIPKKDFELGCIYSLETNIAIFRLWAPTAFSVDVQILVHENDEVPVYSFKSEYQPETGVWIYETNPEETILLDGHFYRYVVSNEKGTFNCLDPYAKSMAAFTNDNTSGLAAIVDLDSKQALSNLTNKKFSSTLPEFKNRSDAIVYEISIRDATINIDGTGGTYTAFIQKLPTIKELGITHIQLLPVLNFYYNNETKKDFEDAGTTHKNNYNWGYDPHNYFTPEGWYSTEPENPYSRISELRQLIDAIHKEGLRVILDVVYNHMAKTDFLDDIVPGYYFRLDENGKNINASCCGNDVASEHLMARKLIVDSTVYWVKNYDVDGFRFDLMGLIDSDTMLESYTQCEKIKENLLFIGEGWKMYTGPSDTRGLDQNFMLDTDDIAVFNDEYRDLCKAGGMNEEGKGILTNGVVNVQQLFLNVTGRPVKNYKVDSPTDSVVYLECHDGLTLHDTVVHNTPINESTADGKKELLARLKIANALLLTSQGICFMQAGQEFGRSKPALTTAMTNDSETIGAFVKNSYDSSDNINQIKWTTGPLYDYTKSLIELRKKSDVFRMKTINEIEKKIAFINIHENPMVLAYYIKNDNELWFCVFNCSKNKYVLNLSDFGVKHGDKISVIANADNVSFEGLKNYSFDSQRDGYTVPSLSVSIIKVE